MEEPCAKCQQDLTTAEEFLHIAKEVQNGTSQKICGTETEDRRFREYFDIGVHVAILA